MRWIHAFVLKETDNNNKSNNCFTANCLDLPGWSSTRTSIHTLTAILIIVYQLLPSTTIHIVWYNMYRSRWKIFFCMYFSVFAQPLSKSSFSAFWTGILHNFFTQSLSFCNTYPYYRSLFCCSIEIMLSIPSLSLNSLLGTLSFTLMSHIHLTILIFACWSATSFSFLTGQVSLLCIILLHTQLL